MAVLLGCLACFGRVFDQFLRLRHGGAVGADQCCGNIFGRPFRHQLGRQIAVFLVHFDRGQKGGQQTLTVLLLNFLRGGGVDPVGVDLGTAQHGFHTLAAGVRHQNDGGAFLAGTAGAARPVLQSFCITRDFHMDDQAERGQIDAAGSNVCGHANAGAAVTHGLHGLVTLRLGMFTRQGHHGKTAFLQGGMKTAHIITRGAEQHGGFRFVETQQIDHGVFDFGR